MKKILSVLLVAVLMLGVLVACNNNNQEPTPLENAKSYLQTMYKDKKPITPVDYERVGVVIVEGVTYTVTWTVDVTEGVVITKSEDGKTVTIDVDEKAAADIPYVLTATIADAEGNTISLEFNYTVPKFEELSFDAYVEAAAGDPVITKGVITALIAKSKGASYNCIYMNDANGGYYVYNLQQDPVADLKLEVGMTIRATGTKDVYNGTHEVKDANIEIIDSNKVDLTVVDFTELFANAADLKAEALVYPQAQLVTIKGVTITGQDAANGYYKFKLGELESYVRISSSTCPLTKDEQAAMKQAHTDHLGYTADVTGVICVYSGAFYLTPVTADAFTNFVLPERDDAGKVAFEKDNLSFATTISKGGESELPVTGATYSDVTISWASDSELAVVNGNKLNVTVPTETATIKLTATITSGEATETKEFEVKILAGSMTYEQIVDAAYGLAAGEALEGTYRLFGVITSVDTAWNDQYSNITVTIQVGDKADKLIQCFRLKGDGAKDLKVGDAITVDGVLKNYNGTIEFDAGCQLVGMGEIASQGTILDIAYALQPGESTEESYTLTGVISSVNTPWSDQYSNITVTIIVDGNTEKPMMCFRLKGEGAQGLKVGDTITVTGTFTNYNGTIEFNAGCTLDKLVPGEGGEEDTEGTTPDTPVTGNYGTLESPLTVTEAMTLCAGLADGTCSAEKVYAKGTITKIGESGNYYKNVYFSDGTTEMLIYTVNLSDGMTELKVGDTVTVCGFIKNYMGTIEFASNGGEYVYIVAIH